MDNGDSIKNEGGNEKIYKMNKYTASINNKKYFN